MRIAGFTSLRLGDEPRNRTVRRRARRSSALEHALAPSIHKLLFHASHTAAAERSSAYPLTLTWTSARNSAMPGTAASAQRPAR